MPRYVNDIFNKVKLKVEEENNWQYSHWLGTTNNHVMIIKPE